MRPFRASIENGSDVISLVNPVGQVLCASAASAKLFGYFPEELIGRNAADLIHPDDRLDSRRALLRVLAQPFRPRQLETRIRQKNGQWCCVESTISNLLDEPRVAAIVVNCREIGARRAQRQQEQKQPEEPARSNAEFEEFAYAVVHDLREPLLTMSMLTKLLANESQLDAHVKELAQLITDDATRMSALLKGLHAFAIHGFGDVPRPLDLSRVVTEALQNLGYAISASGTIVTIDPLPRVQGNETDLLRVFQNLIANSIKYRSAAPPVVHVTAERMGPDWLIKVKDNGIGIAQQYHERVFGLLKRLHGREIPGAGIGLAVCKKAVEALGGMIWVESEPGAGSTFCFTIAAVKGECEVPTLPGDNRYLSGTPAKRIESLSTRAGTQRTRGRCASSSG